MSNSQNTFDAALPAEMAVRAEDAGVKKAALHLPQMFLLAALAGAFIAIGAEFSTTVITGSAEHTGFGVQRLLGGLVFCTGLILVVVAGAELFTGNNLIVMAWASGRVSTARLLRSWLIVYIGNFVGALITAWLIVRSGHYLLADGEVGHTALKIANGKLQPSFLQLVALGTLCNALVCLAVWLTYSCRTTTDKILAVVFPVTAFVTMGLEHCVANMYFVPVALLILEQGPDSFWTGLGSTAGDYPGLTWGAFLWRNLLPVTIGNIIGGCGLVGGVYWVAYRAKSGQEGTENNECTNDPHTKN